MNRSQTLNEIESTGVVAVIRADSAAQCVDLCRALGEGGVTCWEVTMTTPGALHAIEAVAHELGEAGCVGVGSVLDEATAVSAAHAGANFIFGPTFNPAVVDAARRYGKVVVPGALTPTEILAAWEAGADVVKVFPAGHFGPKYFKDIKGPLPQVKLTPTGGVNLDTADAWIKAGAACLGVGSALVNMTMVREGRFDELTTLAKQYINAVRVARG